MTDWHHPNPTWLLSLLYLASYSKEGLSLRRPPQRCELCYDAQHDLELDDAFVAELAAQARCVSGEARHDAAGRMGGERCAPRTAAGNGVASGCERSRP